MDTRSSIERMIDAACGIPDGPPLPQQRKIILLRCPVCKAQQWVAPDLSDPPGTSVAEARCPSCHGGNDEVRFFDKNGKKIVEG